MLTLASCLRRTLVLICVLSIGLPPEALAQTQTQHPDDTNTPLAQQLASQGKEEFENGADRDNPTFRLEWMRHAMSGYDVAARDNYIEQVQKQRDENPDLAPMAPNPSVANNTGSLAFGGATYAPATGKPVWVSIGPTRADYEENGTASLIAMDSGRARAILPHPTDPNVVYLLTSGGGLWKTTDFYSNPPHWVPLTDSLPTTSGGWASFGRVPETLYLGLGDFIDRTLPGGMMVKTTDGGLTWSTPIKLGASLGIRDVKVDTSTANDIVLVASDTGLWRSADNGATYSQVVSGVVGWSLARTSAGWLASVQPCGAGLFVQCAQPGQMLISTDAGATWTPITNTGNVYAAAGRTTIGIGAPGDNIVYLLTASTADNAQGNVFRSSDGGQNWTALGVNATKAPTNPNSNQPNMNLLHAQAYYNQLILVDPTDPNRNTVYIGGDLSTAKTIDGGSTWTIKTNWLAQFGLQYSHADNHSSAFQTAGGKNAVMFGNDGGLFISLDGGTTFDSTRNENLTTHLFYTVAVTPSFPDQIHGGLQDNGTRVKKAGTTVYNQTIGGDGVGAGWSQANSNTAIGSVQQSPRRNLTGVPADSFWDWESVPGLPADNFLQPIFFPRATADPTGKVFFMASTQTLRRSDDGGVTSRLLYQNSAATTNTSIRSSPHNIGVSPYSLDRIGLGGAGGRMVITMNGTAATPTWQAFDLIGMFPPGGANGAGFQGFNYNIAWSDNNTLFVSAAAQIPGAIHILKGTFSGTSWNFVRSDIGIPDVSVQKVVPDPTDPTNQILYAATDIGVYRSADGGATWAQHGAGLPAVRVSDIYIAPNGSYMIIATYGRGMWKLSGLTFSSAALVGDGSGADADGILDNNESGHLVVTLRNYGGTELSSVSAAVSADSSALSFPSGNSFIFPTIPAGGTATASVPVALSGASTGQAINFNISFGDPALNLPTPMAVLRTFRVNYDEAGGTTDDVETNGTSWTLSGPATLFPDLFNWERREITGGQHRWTVRDSDGPNDVALVSPVLKVGSGPFSFSFTHRYAFETTFDGGVIEISTDNGGTWSDVGAANISPTYATAPLVVGGPLGGRRAFTGRIPGYPNSATVTVNLGTAFANKDVRVRFRVGSDDNTGAFGWELDNFAFNGLTNKPFLSVQPSASTVVTGRIDVKRGGFTFNPVTGKFSQVVTLTNNSGADVAGPVSYVLDSLSSNATAVSPSGTTAVTTPAGSPYYNLNIGADNVLSSGESANITIQFTNPTKAAITYTPRVLAGPGAR
jgi:hypothetical protein